MDIEFRLEFITARRAVLPGTGVTLGVVKAAKGVSTMVPGTTGTGIREQDVAAFVIANPLAAAFGPDEIAGLSTKSAAAFA